MFEETNQTETIVDAPVEPTLADLEDLFAEPDSQPEEAAEQQPTEEATEPEAPAEEPRYTVKYNGQEMELPVSELIVNAQKGMNYDHVLEERDRLRNAREFQVIDRYAKMAGKTREEVLDQLEAAERQSQLTAIQQQGVPEELAQQFITMKNKLQTLEGQIQTEAQEKQQQQAYMELIQEYPDVKEIPQEVAERIAAGETPLNAYRSYENKRLKEELAAVKTNTANVQKAVGSVSDDAPQDTLDAFEAGFDSVFR